MPPGFQRRIVRKWKTYAPRSWWGDPVDIRFLLARKLSELRGRKVLDLGCGAGVLASEAAAAGNLVVGLELRADSLDCYRRLFRESGLTPLAVRGDWSALPFRPGSFDTVVLGWVLYCDRDDPAKQRTLERLRELLAPGGMIHLVEANRLCPIQGRGRSCFWSQAQARAAFAAAGFRVVEELGWNPLPSLLGWLPLSVKLRLPRRLLLYLYPPGRLAQWLPGWFGLFRRLGSLRPLQRYCRSYYLRAVRL